MKTNLHLLLWSFVSLLLVLMSLASAWADLPVQLVGGCRTNGYAHAVAISGNYAYVANDLTGLQVVDISNSSAPTRLGSYDTSGYARGVAVSGNYAYIADGSYGLQVIDISNPAAPALVGSYNTSGYAYGIAVSGDYAYVADYSYGLQVINIRNPAAPARVGSYDTSGEARGVAVSGNYAYVADSGAGLQVIDISNPAAPARVGGYNTSGYAYGVAVSGDYAYVADFDAGLQVVNISNPTAPARVGGYDTSGGVCGVAVSGDYAYVADYSSGLQVIDISNPVDPARVGGYKTSGVAWGVTVSGNYTYVACDSGGLSILYTDLSAVQISAITPSSGGNMSSVSITDLSGWRFESGATARLRRASKVDIVATGVTVVSSMKITCTFNLSGAEPGSWNVVVTNLDGESATLADGFTVADGVTAQLVGGCSTGGEADSVAVSGNYAYVVNKNAGLKVVDTSNPNAPAVVGDYGMTDTGYGVSVFGNCAYVAKAGAGWKLIDVSNPSAPLLVQNYTHRIPSTCSPDSCWCYSDMLGPTVIWDKSARMVHSSGGCEGSLCQYCGGSEAEVVIPLPSSSCPVQGSVSNGKTGYGVSVSGSYRFEAGGAAGLRVMNISDPARPLLAGGCDTSGDARDVAVWGNYVYVADGLAGLLILRIEGLPAPTISSVTPNSSPNSGILNVTGLAGTGFLSGAAVKLTKAGQSDIVATGVTVISSTKITCTFDLVGRTLGQWNVVVTNPDGQSATSANGFTIMEGMAPEIRAVTVSPSMVTPDDTVEVAVDATDNVGVTGVTANGTALTNIAGSIWSGRIPADDTFGLHVVTAIARDAAGNLATDTSRSYRTARVLGITDRDLSAYVLPGSAATYLFRTIGLVTRIDADTFELSDGSATAIRVAYPAHGLQTGDYATAQGIWSISTLNASRVAKLL